MYHLCQSLGKKRLYDITLGFILGCLSITFVPKIAIATQIANSNFDDGTLQGWIRAIDGKTGTINNPGTGGNPGGFLEFTDGPTGGPPENVVAPSSYLGDLSQSLDHPSTSFISLDAILLDPAVDQNDLDQIILFLEGPGGSASIDLGLPDTVGQWETFTAFLQESEWTITSGNWSDLLSNVSSFEIQVDWVNPASQQTGLDNIVLNVGAESVPEPLTILGILTAAGLGVVILPNRKKD